MPFALIPTVLGVCFALVWVFIGAMILRDGQNAAREDREEGARRPFIPHGAHGVLRRPAKPLRVSLP